MKKILLILFLFLGINLVVFADGTPVNVLYVHGSNQVNLGGEEGFAVWMNRMHPDLKKNFEKSDFIQLHMLSDGYIKDEPMMLYWGDKLRNNKYLVDEGLEKAQKKSSKVSQFTRGLIGQVVHDAVWLQKNKNMTPILNELNDKVVSNYKKGEKTMLVGYSAGTFITLNYLFMKMPIINVANLFTEFKGQSDISNNDIKFAEKYANNTCVSAAVRSGLFYVDNEGSLLISNNAKQREEILKKLNKQTELYCVPNDALAGVLNFGSPIVVFYSELSDKNDLYKYIVAKTMQNIVETEKFYLTVNYSKDPIAMPIPDFTFEKIKENKYCKNIKKGNGFIYDTIVKGGFMTAEGHMQYWYSTNGYTKAVAKSYAEGYKVFYNK